MVNRQLLLQRLIRMRAVVLDLTDLVDVKYYDRRMFEVHDVSDVPIAFGWNHDVLGVLADYLRSVCNDLKQFHALPPEDHVAYDINQLMAFFNELRNAQ